MSDKTDPCNVFVANLGDNVTDSTLRGFFSKYGEIESLLVLPSTKGKYAFIRYVNEQDANVAMQSTRGKMFEGRKLFVKIADANQQQKKGSSTFRKADKGGLSNADKPDLVVNHQTNKPKSQIPSAIRQEQLLVTHIQGACVFWAQVFDAGKPPIEMLHISDSLVAVCPMATPLSGPPQPDKIYAAQFSEDNMWYRCRLLKTVSDTQSCVQYVDYGNTEEKDNCQIVELPPSVANVKPQAQKYVLYGLKTFHFHPDSIGYQQGIDKLHSLTYGKLVTASVYPSPRDSGVIPVAVSDGDVDINQEILDAGFGERRIQRQSSSSSASSQPSSQAGGMALSSSSSQGQGNAGIASRQEQWAERLRMGGGDMPAPGYHPHVNSVPMSSVMPQPYTTSIGSGGGYSGVTVVDSSVTRLEAELQQTKRELFELQSREQAQLTCGRAERDLLQRRNVEVVMELATTRGRLKTLEQEYVNLTEQLQSSTLQNRMKNLIAGINKVKELRMQFPTGTEMRDSLEDAISAVTSAGGRISLNSLPSLPDVEQAIANYQTAKEAIRACLNTDLLAELVATRDAMKCVVFEKIESMLVSIHQLPLDDRAEKLRRMITSIEKTHAPFLLAEMTAAVELNAILEPYHSWKRQKEASLEKVRAVTDSCHSAVVNAFHGVINHLSLNILDNADDASRMPDLDELLANFLAAIEQEIETSSLQSSSESSLVTVVLKTLINELLQEEKTIQHIRELRASFIQLRDQLRPWLTSKPSVNEVKLVRQAVRSLKSRLRHQLADRQDAEETDDVQQPEELDKLNSAISETRTELQILLAEEDNLVHDLAQLHELHFPELVLLHPELGIENELTYGGLLKSNRSLDYFDLVPDSHSKCVFSSTFCGEPVTLKEVIIDEAVGTKKSDFLRRAVSYKNVISEHVLPLHAIFFGKNERQAYIQIAYRGRPLNEMIDKKTSLNSQSMMRDVLHGLADLHDAKLVHGAIHPRNILVSDDGRACVTEFDFTKSLTQRSEKAYVTESGLKFQPPGGAMARASDMFNFGLLLLWWHFPDVHFDMKAGVPVVSSCSMSSSLASLFSALCDTTPELRPAASDVLNHPYFTVPEPTAELAEVVEAQVDAVSESTDAVLSSQTAADDNFVLTTEVCSAELLESSGVTSVSVVDVLGNEKENASDDDGQAGDDVNDDEMISEAEQQSRQQSTAIADSDEKKEVISEIRVAEETDSESELSAALAATEMMGRELDMPPPLEEVGGALPDVAITTGTVSEVTSL